VVHPDKKQDSKMSDPIKTFWHNITKTEPYWSVLTNDKYMMENIELSEFYKTGEQHVKRLLEYVTNNNLVSDINNCLDFGCGVGRVTASLSKIANHVDALDLSSGMIEIANQYFKENSIDNITLVDTSIDSFLPKLYKYDLVFSCLVLQHNPKPRAIDLLGKLCQSISKRGVGIIYIHSKLKGDSPPTVSYAMQMHELPLKDAMIAINKNGCELVEYNLNSLTEIVHKQPKAEEGTEREAGYLVVKAVA
jgi:2-polyprenyl-3-methyl-5-hydroxy-6-metoxy-1,4-benzoquinol methylase